MLVVKDYADRAKYQTRWRWKWQNSFQKPCVTTLQQNIMNLFEVCEVNTDIKYRQIMTIFKEYLEEKNKRDNVQYYRLIE